MPARRTKPDDRLMCRHCRLPIQGAVDRRLAVWLAVGPLHAACHVVMQQAVTDLIAAAVRAGTHSTGPALQVCAWCREWRQMYHVTLAGESICRGCTPADLIPERARKESSSPAVSG